MAIPDILWAQDKKHVHITIQQINATDVDINILEDSIKMKFKSNLTEYDCNLDLFGKINIDNSNWTCNRNIKFILERDDTEYWTTLLKSKNYKHKIKTDWSKWVDEDESDDDNSSMGGMPGMEEMMRNMGGMGGMPGMGMPGMEGMSGMEGIPGMEGDNEGGMKTGVSEMLDKLVTECSQLKPSLQKCERDRRQKFLTNKEYKKLYSKSKGL